MTTDLEFGAAMRQIEHAANNLSSVSSGTGDTRCLRASQLLMMIKNAFLTGVHITEGAAAAFDDAIREHEAYKE